MAGDNEQIKALKAQGAALMRGNRLAEAKTLFARICEIRPDDAQAWYMLSSINGMLGNMDEAGECCRRVIALRPDHSEAHANLGNVLFFRGRLDEAIGHYQTAIGLNPGNALALCNLGNVLSALGRYDEAAANYQAAIRLNPASFEAYYNLGNAQLAQRDYAQAAEQYRHAIGLNPAHAFAYNNLGNAFKEQGALKQAAEQYRRAAALQPDLVVAHNNLAIVLLELGELEAADEAAQQALRLQSDSVDAYFNLGNIRLAQSQPKAAIAYFQRALDIDPHHAGAHSSVLMLMHYLPEYSPEDLLAAARDWAARHSPPQRSLPAPANLPDPQRRLRVGYVSGDFYSHPVGIFIEAVLAHHDKSRYEVFCYYNRSKHDDLTARLQKSADHWCNVAGESDDELAQRVRRDSIDLLVDLAGHTAANRLPVFARKPAPVQATWMGYFATTGLPAMDYIIADRFVIPPQEERYYVERVARLPNAYLCFSPPEYKIEPGPLPALAAGKVTFGCFNNPSKLTDGVIACWSRLLHALPEAQLYVKYKPFGDAAVRQRYLAQFASRGIAPERVRFSGRSPRNELLTAYREVDIGLDPFPYNGGITTLESLWMGVPVVTLRGDHFVSRVGDSLMTNAGLVEYIAATEDEYIAKALGLASDLPRLAELRGRLRAQLLASPLCDGRGYTRDMENVYREIWTTWCRAQAHRALNP
jgi:predicted O-linked N-acetylglucosamine transferase (SPINDLY family)